jgi:hypothetical protein
MTIPSKFIPASANDFIGAGDFGAATAARMIESLVAQAQANHCASMAILINGKPGIGKSALARWLIHDVLRCSKFSVTRLNGTQVNLERVEDIAANLPYRDLYADYKVLWVEECDRMGHHQRPHPHRLQPAHRSAHHLRSALKLLRRPARQHPAWRNATPLLPLRQTSRVRVPLRPRGGRLPATLSRIRRQPTQ